MSNMSNHGKFSLVLTSQRCRVWKVNCSAPSDFGFQWRAIVPCSTELLVVLFTLNLDFLSPKIHAQNMTNRLPSHGGCPVRKQRIAHSANDCEAPQGSKGDLSQVLLASRLKTDAPAEGKGGRLTPQDDKRSSIAAGQKKTLQS